MAEALKEITWELTTALYNALKDQITYPVYKVIPKQPESAYVYIGNVTYNTEGTKDDWLYSGMVTIRVVDESHAAGDLKEALEVVKEIRQILKPNKTAVLSLSTSNNIIFSPASTSATITLSEEGLARNEIFDIYRFVIE